MNYKRLFETHLFLAFATVYLVACNPDADSNKDLVQQFVEVTNNHDFAKLDEIVAADVVRHSPSTPGLVITSLDELRAFLEQDASTFQGARVDVETIISEGNRVALIGKFSGKHISPVGPIEATGITVAVDMHAMFRIEGDHIAEFWVLWDNLALLTQLGYSPFGAPDDNQGE